MDRAQFSSNKAWPDVTGVTMYTTQRETPPQTFTAVFSSGGTLAIMSVFGDVKSFNTAILWPHISRPPVQMFGAHKKGWGWKGMNNVGQ